MARQIVQKKHLGVALEVDVDGVLARGEAVGQLVSNRGVPVRTGDTLAHACAIHLELQ